VPQVVNLVSNDVRRFDEAMPFWVFLWAGPLELAIVVLMISLELGAAAAFAGIAALLALIPLQVGVVLCVTCRRCFPLCGSTSERQEQHACMIAAGLAGTLHRLAAGQDRKVH